MMLREISLRPWWDIVTLVCRRRLRSSSPKPGRSEGLEPTGGAGSERATELND